MGKATGGQQLRALRCLLRALFLTAFLASSVVQAAGVSACAPDRIDEAAQVASVTDGDTVRLSDGRRVRFIGLNTPELGRDGAPDQPFALEGRSALQQLLGPRQSVGLRFDQERRDRHGRILAHAFVGHTKESITAAMLRRGSGTLLVVPPNTWNWECYAAAEAVARTGRVGVWGLPAYQPRAVSELPRGFSGYAIVRDRVASVGRSRDSTWINFAGPLALRIERPDLENFHETEFERWAGRTLQARGWIRAGKKGSLVMDVRHPAAIDAGP